MAAHHYYYKEIKGLRRPPKNGTLNTKLRIRCYDEKNDDKNGEYKPSRKFLGLGSAIKIYNPQNRMNDIYSTTIHEIAHASHWNMGINDYNNTDDKVCESWARGVQWELTRMVWPDYVGGANIPPNYTSVVIDMIDDFAPFDSNGNLVNQNTGSEDILQDAVTGYTIRQLEDALKGKKSWDEWRNNIINKYNNATENNLNILFAHWN